MSIYRGIPVSSIIGISSIVSGCGSSSSSGSTITDSGGDTELSDSYKDSHMELSIIRDSGIYR